MPGEVTITPCQVRALSLTGEFDKLTDPQIQAVIDYVAKIVNLDVCGDLAEDYCKFFTAHLLTMRKRSGSKGGPVTAQSAGGISQSYAVPSSLSERQAWLMQSPWGQEVMHLQRIIPATPLALNTRFGFVYDTVP